MTNPTIPANDTGGFPISLPLRALHWWEWQQLERQGCSATVRENVRVTDSTDLRLIHNVHFSGPASIGILSAEPITLPGGRTVRPCLHHAVLDTAVIGDNAAVSFIAGGLHNVTIGARAVVSNVARIEFEPEAPCGVGIKVDVLDESGSRPVTIYPGLSSQLAAMMARMPQWSGRHLQPILQAHIESLPERHGVGAEAVVRDCGPIKNVYIDGGAVVEGASYLENGSIINNAAPGRPLANVGAGVDARNFIFEDASVGASSIIRNCYVGQGVVIDKGFTAHDSLFFANCSMENGEACAFFGGPYSVSMHKSTLLIGCQTSFMNAGSASNQSNHMYKLGPVHWGVLERGVKTSSNSYLMLGANIGAFSLLMGDHKTHPDSTMFPFSYLFGDERGATVVVPGQMLRSCGLMRDEKKWPTRDRRLKRRLPLHDRIHFSVLNPYTIDRMLDAIPVIDALLAREADDDRVVRWRGMKFSRASLERARNLYTIAIYKYLHTLNEQQSLDVAVAHDGGQPSRKTPPPANPDILNNYDACRQRDWIDLAGQIMPRNVLEEAMDADSIEGMEQIFTNAFDNFDTLQREWVLRRFGPEWSKHPAVIEEYAAQFDRQVEQDRTDYLASLSAETAALNL